jgi:uncharacterized membrane protein
MTTRNVQSHSCGRAGDSTTGRLTNALGWFSLGLGLAEIISPGALGNLIGVRSRPKSRLLLRLYGLREIAAGVGILTQRRPAGWMWARVAGDAVDLSSLAGALGNRRNDRTRVGLAIASVAGVTAADVYCAKQLSEGTTTGTRVIRSIIIDRPVEEVYGFWHDFENLPRFMTYLQSVRYTGDRRMHWIAKGPGGSQIEWDAEVVIDEPNRMIAWRSAPESPLQTSGSVRFERAPGNRGTLVRVEVEFARGMAVLGNALKMGLARRIIHDLRTLKQVLEVGEVTQSEATLQPGMHPARPEPVYQH